LTAKPELSPILFLLAFVDLTCSYHHHDDDFIYEDGPAEDAAADAEDLWDPTEDFYYDDDPEDFEVDPDEDVQVGGLLSALCGNDGVRGWQFDASGRRSRELGCAH
jgi:hypothetical protein